MSSEEEIRNTETQRSNAEVVVDALKSINGPATVTNVVDYLAAVHELNPHKIREPVKEVLTSGYNLGFLNKKGTKYELDPHEMTFREDYSKFLGNLKLFNNLSGNIK